MWQNVGWARVSSDEQAKGYSIENQCKRLEGAGCDKIISDVESAYKPGQEAKFNELVAIVHSKQAKQITICDFDRLSRNELIGFQFYDLLEKSKIKLLSLNQPYIDILTPDGRAMAGHLLVENRAYSARLSAKVRQGHKAHRDRNAAYFAPFGYQVVDERYELDHEPFLCLLEDGSTRSRAAIARELVEMFLEARSLRGTLIRFNTQFGIATRSHQGKGNRHGKGKLSFHTSGLGSWLNNPILRGHTAYGRGQKQRQIHKHLWDIRLDTHPDHLVMSEAEYLQIEEILDYNSEHGGFSFAAKVVHPLSGLIYCGECGGRCRTASYRLRTDRSIKKYSYQCSNYHYRRCTQKPSIREEILEAALVKALSDRAISITQKANLPELASEPIALQELRRQLRVLEGLGENAAIATAREDLRRQIEQMGKATTQEEASAKLRHDDLVRVFGTPDFWVQLSDTEKQKLYRWLIFRLWMRNGQIDRIELRC